MFSALLYVNNVAVLSHNLQSFDSILLRGKVDWGEVFLIQNIRSHGTVIGNNQRGK